MDYFLVTQDFIEESRKARSLKDLAQQFEKTIKSIGCTYFVCASSVDPLNLPDQAVFLTNYPEAWPVYFSEQEYYKIDPIYLTSLSQIIPFTWSSELWRARLDFNQKSILNEANEVGLGEGYTVPIHSSTGYPASCSVVFSKGEVDPRAFSAVHLMSCYLYETALNILKDNKVEPVNRLLTERQRQCLEYVAQGKSDWVISELLHISESTVHYHIQRILRILKVATRAQAVVSALYLGEINFLDISQTSNNKSGFINLT